MLVGRRARALAGGGRPWPPRRAPPGRRTVLVECDLARPRLAADLGLAPGPGLHEYLRWEAEAAEILQPLVLAGPAAAGAGEPLVCIAAGRAGRRRRRRCSASRASATRSRSCAAPTSWSCSLGPPLEVAEALPGGRGRGRRLARRRRRRAGLSGQPGDLLPSAAAAAPAAPLGAVVVGGA